MKKSFFFAAMSCVVLGVAALCLSACGGDPATKESPTEGLTYTLNEDGASYTVSGMGTATRKHLVIPKTYEELPVTAVGARAFLNCDGLESVTLPDTIRAIENYAFKDCSSITELVIPSSVTHIGQYAFQYCANLETVVLSNGVLTIEQKAFEDCGKLREVVLPDSLLSLGAYAFEDCKSLESVTIGAGLEDINKAHFGGCTSLTAYTVSENNAAFCSVDGILYKKDLSAVVAAPLSLSGELALPQGLFAIPDYAFFSYAITSLTLPDSLQSIGAYAFSECAELAEVNFGSGLRSLGEYAFSKCAALTDCALPQALYTIGNYAFFKCEKLREIVIPESVTDLGQESFASCFALQKIAYNAKALNVGSTVFRYSGSAEKGITVTVGAKVKTIPDYLFNSLDTTSLPIQTVVFEEGSVCEKIGISAFKNCNLLASVNLPETVSSIGNSAFQDCASLQSIPLSEQLTNVGAYTFDGCEKLTAVNLGKNVAKIGERAFARCAGLVSITVSEENADYTSIEGNLYDKNGTVLIQYALGNPSPSFTVTGVSSIGNNAFEGCKNLTSLTVDDSVNTIGEAAFKGCESLTAITLSDEIEFMGANVFEGCTALTEITLPNSLAAVSSFTFVDCESLSKVTFGIGMSEIKAYAFVNCNALKSVSIPKQILTVDHSAFYECAGLREVYIDSGTQSIDKLSFNYCNALQSFTVSEENAYYASQDGILYNKAKTEILVIPEDLTGEVEIPEGITSIANSAWPFMNRENLTAIVLPASLNFITSHCFDGCTALTAVTFKKTDGWNADEHPISQDLLADPATAALYLTDTYSPYTWQRN